MSKMAARTIGMDELKAAVQEYAARHELTVSSNEKGFCLMPGDVIVTLLDGKPSCSNAEILDSLIEILMDLAEEPARAPSGANLPARQGNVPPARRNGQDGAHTDFDMENWRKKQARSYSAAGKEAPNAFSVSEEANKRGLSTQIMDSGRTKELVWGHVRVMDPKSGQFREDRVSHEKEVFCLLKSWEDANSQARYQKPGSPALIIGIADNNMPILNPDVKIKGMPAPLWLTMQLMRAWSFADRDAITKAERRAQLKMLNREWREDDEIILEQEEEKAVQDSIERARA